MKALDWLKGKKTYIVAIASAVYGLGIQLGWWPHVVAVDTLLGSAGLAALRAGVNNAVADATTKPQ